MWLYLAKLEKKYFKVLQLFASKPVDRLWKDSIFYSSKMENKNHLKAYKITYKNCC